MPGSSKEKEKCLEKLTQMEKYLPFLDFMIDKIKKKNKETSWECPLNKFQNLRSMITEKSKRHNWDAIIKVENVIQKLIVKIDYKEEEIKEPEKYLASPKPDSVESPKSTDSSVSTLPSCTTTVITNTSSLSHVTSADSRPRDSPTNTVDFIMNKLKMSIDSKEKNNKCQKIEKESSEKVVGPKESWDGSLETDLHKDLDGFDLSDAPSLSSGKAGKSSVKESEVPKTVSSHQDLLSTSRKKLMMSLGKVLGSPFLDRSSPQTCFGSKSTLEQTSDSQSVSAFSSGDMKAPSFNSAPERTKSDTGGIDPSSDKDRQSSNASATSNEKPVSVPISSPKSPSEHSGKQTKSHCSDFPSKCPGNFYEKQQTIRERLSADISEILRVPGKSVGGSLRSLKYAKNLMENKHSEETELVKAGEEASTSTILPSDGKSPVRGKKSHEMSFKSKVDGKGEENSIEKESLQREKNEISKQTDKEYKAFNKNWNPPLSDKEPGVSHWEKWSQRKRLQKSDEMVKENLASDPRVTSQRPTLGEKSSWKCTPLAAEHGNPNIVLSSSDATSGKIPADYKRFKSRADHVNKLFASNERESISSDAAKNSASSYIPVIVSTQRKNTYKGVNTNIQLSNDVYDVDDSEYAQRLIEETTPNPAVIKINTIPMIDSKTGIPKVETSLGSKEPIIHSMKETKFGVFSKQEARPRRDQDQKMAPVVNAHDSSAMQKLLAPHSESAKQDPIQYSNSVPSSSVNVRGGNDLNSFNSYQNTKINVQRGKELPLIQTPLLDKIPRNISAIENHPNPVPIHPAPGAKLETPISKQSKMQKPISHNLYEPKSYAEYKRMKWLNEERLKRAWVSQQPKKGPQPPSSTMKEQTPQEKSVPSINGNGQMNVQVIPQGPSTPHCTKNFAQRQINVNPHHRRRRQPNHSRKSMSRTQNQMNRVQKTFSNESKTSKNMVNSKKESQEIRKKNPNEKKTLLDGEESISPLECLYEEESTMKRRQGYGILKFKIPKKVPQNSENIPIQQENITLKEELKRKIQNLNNKTIPNNEHDNTEAEKGVGASSQSSKIPSEGASSNTPKGEPPNNRDAEGSSFNDTQKPHSEKSETLPKSAGLDNGKGENVPPVPKLSGTELTEPMITEQKEAVNEEMALNANSNEKSTPTPENANNKGSNEDTSKAHLSSDSEAQHTRHVPKEEITQDLVEALIRKSFQSGEGKLLLAQAKLFEKLARKLNSEKLKTIQKIINSDNDSASSSEHDSENEKKKKVKLGKSGRGKRKKRRYRKIRKLESSSEEEDEICQREPLEKSGNDKTIEGTNVEKNEESNQPGKTVEMGENESPEKNLTSTETPDTEAYARKPPKSNQESPEANLRKCMSNKKNLRKQGQEKLLEQILNEKSEPDSRPDSRNSDGKEPEQKTRGRQKGKTKTELDRLHDDIKNMFICSGVVTATGIRMCRMLKESGGRMNDLDLVKESAKMVKEQKLKVLEGKPKRTRGRVAKIAHEESETTPLTSSPEAGYSSTLSLDMTGNVPEEPENSTEKIAKPLKTETDLDTTDKSVQEAETPRLGPIVSENNFTKQPCVLLHKLDLSTWNYGVKVSEGDRTFCMGGKPTVPIRQGPKKPKSQPLTHENYRPKHNVYLARNIRVVRRQPTANPVRKTKKRKSLEDILKKLYMKNSSEGTSSKNLMEKNNMETRTNALTLNEMFSYAFEQNKSKYECLLCPTVTKNIVPHYKNFHQESEVLISRLSPMEAKSAIAAAKKNNYISLSGNHRSPSKPSDLKNHNSRKKATLYCCRFCGWAQTTNINLFFTHIVRHHTGECKHRCPANKCSYSTNSRDSIKSHVQKTHALSNYDNSRGASLWCPLFGRSKRLYGYMCSTCHYVQISLVSLKTHIKIQHPLLKNVRILKINMSKTPSENITNVEGQNNASNSENKSTKKHRSNESSLQKKIQTICGRKRPKTNDSACLTASKKVRLHGNEALKKPLKDRKSENSLHVAISDTVSNFTVKEEAVNLTEHEADCMPESILLENCFDVESVTRTADKTKGSGPGLTKPYGKTMGRPIRKLKVGPLEAQILDNAVVLYECFVKGCLFSTKVFDLFEKHVKISHAKTKWNGICKVCYERNGSQVHLTSYKLIYALNHLKHHERDNEAVTIKSISALNKPVLDVKPPILNVKKEIHDNSNDEASALADDPSYPQVPLLRVRNLVGDRLSTPKDTASGFVTNSDCMVPTEKNKRGNGITDAALSLDEEAPAMFTIENVRSLKPGERAEESDGQVIHNSFEQETAEAKGKEAVQNKTVWNSRAIPIRSCPTRPIAIRPDLQVDGNQLRVVQAAPVTSVILNPLPAPLRSITPLPSAQSTSKFSVQPVMVSVNPPFLTTSKTVSVMVPVSSPKITSATSTSALLSLEESSSGQQVVVSDEINMRPIEFPNTVSSSLPEVTISLSDSPKKSEKSKRIRTKVYRSNQDGAASSSEADETDDGKTKTSNSPQKPSTSTTGSKSVKDTKIYEEMLSKTKLCHLFKCMAVECSFTCNTETIFTQHIGLHEAQRRMNKKTTKNTGIDAKLRKTTNWYQCAYCCEVLASTSFALSQHIIMEHGHCIYQCAYCFYRAVSQSYVEIHQNLVHGHLLETKPRVIYKCKPLSRGPSDATALEKHTRRQSVRPYHCDQCGAKFFITQEFLTHLTTEHQSVTAYTCHICKNLFFKAERLINHYKLHSYCTFQCAYCLHGTEIQKEMVYHLCNFHFSQPAYMYVRALAENQSNIGLKKPMKKKKVGGNQLDSLKVVVYEYDKLSPDCIVEAESNEDLQDEPPKNEESSDISAIAAELGISIEPGVCTDAEEASGDAENAKSEDTVLLSHRTPRESTEERDVSSVPLGQLSLEVVSAGGRKETEGQPDAENASLPDKNLKLNEILIQLQNKDKSVVPGSSPPILENPASGTKEKVATAFHKLPPVVLSRITGPKNVYPPKTTPKGMSSKKTEDSLEDNIISGDQIGKEGSNQLSTSEPPVPTKGTETCEPDKTEKTKQTKVVENQTRTVMTKGVNSKKKNESFQSSHNLGKPSSKPLPRKKTAKSDKAAKSLDADSTALKPPIIRVEDFSLDDEVPNLSVKKATEIKTEKILPESNEKAPSDSPDVVIIEEDKTDVLTVTIDSEDEKEPEGNEKHPNQGVNEPCTDGRTIRKEMEKLRNQIANETDCLLFDDLDVKVPASNLDSGEKTSENPPKKGFLSPIEEAISSLNKKLEEEGEKRKNEKTKDQEEAKKQEEVRTIPRTRSSTKERAKRGEEGLEKSDSDDSNMAGSLPSSDFTKKDQKTFKVGLFGKDLFICGNDKCDFSADGYLELKDHLYVCDLSRETSSLMCPHCFKFIKQFNAYIEHLKHHGEQKYACGLCSFKSAVEMSVTRHVKQKHKCDQLKTVPMDPPKEGYMMYYPKSFKLEKQDFETSGYSPGDEDKLPLQAVYQVNVKCAKCPYFTKVRSNMVRHLKIHVKSAETEGVVIVPSTAPTNPVPCLDTKEKMFDKMTNLAASSQLAQAREKTAIEALAPEDEAKLPQFVAEQMRYKCCLPDCNYITVDEGMLKHHIKALHDEITYYSCPHCSNEVHVEVRHVTLDKIGYHLKLHDGKLYKCPHCTYFHYQKAVVEKHTLEKHPERRYYVHTVREPRSDPVPTEETPAQDVSSKAWKCGLCNDCQSFSKVSVMDHVAKVHGTKSKYKCRLCDMKSNLYHSFFAHFASKHPGEKVAYMKTIVQVTSTKSESSPSKADFSGEHFDTTPLWQRGAPRVRHIRGILIEEEEVRTKKNKKPSEEAEVGPEETETVTQGTGFHCPICKKKFCARNADFFRSHLYQELNYQQFACTLCGKMFVDKKDYEKHHAKTHPDKAQAMKQTKEDGEIMFWVDKVIARQKEEIENKKRQLSENSSSDTESPQKKRRKSEVAQELRLPV